MSVSQNQRKRVITPIFKTHGSLGKSIISADKSESISPDGTVSILSIVKEHNLKEITVCDDGFLCFPKLYKQLKGLCKLNFGINFYCCSSVDGKGDESIRTESKVTVFMKNSDGYRDLLKLHNVIHTDQRYQYYKVRMDWETLANNWTDNLELVFPPYDNFIHNNSLKDGECVPQLKGIKPSFFYSDMGLPFDYLLKSRIKEYASNNSLDLYEVHPVYYYSDSDLKPYIVFRSIANIKKRANFSCPELEFCTSNQFSFESYLRKVNNV